MENSSRTKATGTNSSPCPGSLATRCSGTVEKGTISDAIGGDFSIRLGRAAGAQGLVPPSLQSRASRAPPDPICGSARRSPGLGSTLDEMSFNDTRMHLAQVMRRPSHGTYCGNRRAYYSHLRLGTRAMISNIKPIPGARVHVRVRGPSSGSRTLAIITPVLWATAGQRVTPTPWPYMYKYIGNQ